MTEMKAKKKIAVLVSGGGTNLQALIDAQKKGILVSGEISLVLSSTPDAYALERARQNGIGTAVVNRKDYASREEFTAAICDKFEEFDIDYIILAGFMYILDRMFTERYENRILNVHPALIPSFCGDGFYGLRVHQAALDAGVKVTGATVHFVTEVCDGGPIIAQRAVEIKEGDTPEILQRRVMEEAEWIILPQAAEMLCAGRLSVEGNIVHIAEA